MKAIVAVTLYISVSVLATTCNKLLLDHFNFNSLVLLLQSLLIVVFIHFAYPSSASFDIGIALSLLPLVFFYIANVYVALNALRMTSLPVYNAVKRCAPLPVMFFDFILRGKRHSIGVIVSVSVIVFGALVMSQFDLDANFGYFYASLSCVLQSIYLVLTARGGDKGLSTVQVLFYNSLLSVPFLLLHTLYELNQIIDFFVKNAAKMSETAAATTTPTEAQAGVTNGYILATLAATVVMGSFLNFALFYCTMVNSSLTTVIAGQLKGILSTLLGVVFWDNHILFFGWVGILLNTIGGISYGYVKYLQQNEKLQSEDHHASTHNK